MREFEPDTSRPPRRGGRGPGKTRMFMYVFKNIDVDFEVWSGRGMHFTVEVDLETGHARVWPGE